MDEHYCQVPGVGNLEFVLSFVEYRFLNVSVVILEKQDSRPSHENHNRIIDLDSIASTSRINYLLQF